jgi:RNA polymerase sigma factor (sigma-70 family)
VDRVTGVVGIGPGTRTESSFEDFVEARAGALFRTALLLTGQAADAEDLVQETLIRLLRSWTRVAEAASPEAYATRALVNTFTSLRRRVRYARERLTHRIPEVRIDDAAERACDHLTLHAALDTLPPRQRATIVLRYYDG